MNRKNVRTGCHRKGGRVGRTALPILLSFILIVAMCPAYAIVQGASPASPDAATSEQPVPEPTSPAAVQERENDKKSRSVAPAAAPVYPCGIIEPDLSALTDRFQIEITTTEADTTFYIPTKSNEYDWNVYWGDAAGYEHRYVSPGDVSSDLVNGLVNVGHTYALKGTYRITITPGDGSDGQAWLKAYGPTGTGVTAVYFNLRLITKALSPIKPNMTRTDAQITGEAPPPHGEWENAFNDCSNLTMGEDFTFDEDAWANVTKVGNDFAEGMFQYCNGDAFTMNSVFNLPQGLTSVGDYFAHGMFAMCDGDAFTMNNLFNLPQGITNAGSWFANWMFYNCNGDAFTMNSVFNLPQGITRIVSYFANWMFYNCDGDAFLINSVFRFPSINSEKDPHRRSLFSSTFFNIHTAQMRSIASIIGDWDTPSSLLYTFTDSEDAFSDWAFTHVNWGGGGQERPIADPSYIVGFEWPDETVTATYGTANDASALKLPQSVSIEVVPAADPDAAHTRRTATVAWDASAPDYNPRSYKEQSFYYEGTITLPSNITNPYGVPLRGGVDVTVTGVNDGVAAGYINMPYYSHLKEYENRAYYGADYENGKGIYNERVFATQYSDSFWSDDSSVFYVNKAIFAQLLAASATSMDTIYHSYEALGLQDIRLFNYRKDITGEDITKDIGGTAIGYDGNQNHVAGYAFGRKTVSSNGKDYNLVVVSVRGTEGEMGGLVQGLIANLPFLTGASDGNGEWASNAMFVNPNSIGPGNHYGFSVAKDQLYSSLGNYCKAIQDSTGNPNKFLITGHSRGAAIANLLTADMDESESLGKKEDIYAYTFATPNTMWLMYQSCPNLFNLVNPDDPVTGVPFSRVANVKTGYWKYGGTFAVPSPQTNSIGETVDEYFKLKYPNYPIMETAFRGMTGKSIDEFKGYLAEFNSAAPALYAHNPEVYLAWLISPVDLKEEQLSGEYISVHCPVDVEIYDDKGRLAVKVVDNKVVYDEPNDFVYPIIDGDEKNFLIRSSFDYKVNLTGSDTGKMDYSVAHLNACGPEPLSLKEFKSVALTTGKTFESDVTDETTNEVKLYVVEDDKKVAEVGVDGKESALDGNQNNEPPIDENPDNGLSVAIESLSIDRTALSLAPGKSAALTVGYAPANTTEKPTVTWASSSPNIATVDGSGKVTAKAEGEATVTATVPTKSSTLTASCKVTVMKNVSKLGTPLKTIYLKKKSRVTIPLVAYSPGSETAKLTWKSGNEKIATVNASGKVTAKKKGTTKITATALNGKSVTVTVKVVNKAKKLAKIAIKGAPKTLKKGKTARITVKITPATVTNLKVTFKSSKPAVLSVDKAGKLTAKKKGKAVITVKAGGKTSKKTITVK